MKHVGIIGGIGPEATMDYYRAIIAGVQQVKHSTAVLPEISIRSIDMYRMFSMLDREDYPAVEAYLGDAAEDLRHGGADFGLMCGNTPHIVFDGIQRRTALPLLSIVTSALQEAQRRGLLRLGLLGTKFTMHHDFFTSAFQAAGIAMVTPEAADQELIHARIVDELEQGIVRDETRTLLLGIVSRMVAEHGLDGIVLGCTELPLILSPENMPVATLDIADIHIRAIVARILAD